MELFLSEEIPKEIKEKIKDRIWELEETQFEVTAVTQQPMWHGKLDKIVGLETQSPSMQRVMAQNPDLIPKPPQPMTPAAAQALAARQALINGAANEKPENGRKSPRKI